MSYERSPIAPHALSHNPNPYSSVGGSSTGTYTNANYNYPTTNGGMAMDNLGGSVNGTGRRRRRSDHSSTVESYSQQDLNERDEEYNRLLKNYKLAHERIELQRLQMLEQEGQNALLRKHVSLLEGGDSSSASVVDYSSGGGGGTTIDDFTLRNCSSSLARRINRWAADTITELTKRTTHDAQYQVLIPLANALYVDIEFAKHSPFLLALHQVKFEYSNLGMVVQNLMRHAMSEMLCYGIVNEFLVTNSEEANKELTRVHEQLFDREPLIAAVWRRHTFSAAVADLTPLMASSLFNLHIPTVFNLINPSSSLISDLGLAAVLEASYSFSRMLHSSASPTTGGSAMDSSGFYRAFVPAIGSQLNPANLELTKRCHRTERGEKETVGACLFPGLVKVIAIDDSMASIGGNKSSIAFSEIEGAVPGKVGRETRMIVVRRAQVICECAMAA